MKICPYCSGQLEDDDVKCRLCGEWIIQGRGKAAPSRGKKGKRKKNRGWRPRASAWIVAGLALWGIYRVFFSGGGAPGLLGGRPPLEVVRADLEALTALQDEYAREHGGFTGNTFSLGFTASEGVTVSLTAAPAGWSATGIHRNLPASEGCAVFVGDARPPVSPLTPPTPGIVACTE
jgi:hypothetical protein